MLIVSKFYDYYDTAATYGVDKTIVYNRKQGDFTYTYEKGSGHAQPNRWEKHQPWRLRLKNYKDLPDYIDSFIIGFCGKFYPLYVFQNGAEREFIYNKDEVLSKLKDLDLLSDYGWDRNRNLLSHSYIEAFFDEKKLNYLLPLFMEHKTPIFMLKDTRMGCLLSLSPALKDYKFGKVMPAPQCFQEIQNYISGVLGTGERDIVDISNEMQAAKKGYDKWSFRTMPGDSKKPRGKKK